MAGKSKGAKRKSARKAPSHWSTGGLADAVDALVCDCRDGVIVAVNQRGRRLLGYQGRATPVGDAFHTHVEGDLQPALRRSLASLTRGTQPQRLVMKGRNGVRVIMDVTAKTDRKGHTIIVGRPVESRAPAAPPDKAHPIDEPGRALQQASQILAAAAHGIVAATPGGVITLANPAAADLLNRDAGAMVGLSLERAFVYGSGHPQAGKPLPLLAQFKSGPFHTEQEAHLARTDGASFEAVYVVAPYSENRQVMGYVITFRDITQRRRSEAELRLAAAVFDHNPEGLIVADARGRVTKINPAYRRIVGAEQSEVIGRQMSEVLFVGANASSSVLDALDGKDHTQWEQWCTTRSGRRYAARISVSVVRDESGNVQQYVGIVADITQRKLDEEKIIHQANYDQLTGLPNRTLFMDRLTRRVLEGRRANASVGLMFIDLDGFKAINDTLGHDAGDLLLKMTARRLEKCVREADTVARLGGDEFTVIMPLIDSLEAAGIVAGRIIKALTEPFDLNGRQGHVSASIGISLLPAQASSANQLLHNADVAMYHAKRLGKANYQFYDSELETSVHVKDRTFA
jgi:diguanylate cyclase (GGDEF)-like protein/PAS domain S-box-containing protein